MSGVKATIQHEGVSLTCGEPASLPLGTAVRNLAKSEAEAAAYHALDELWQDGLIEEVAPGR